MLIIINSDRIAKLKNINEKLQKELKAVSGTLSKSSEKQKLRQKASNNENIKAKERELDIIQRQMQGYQKEIALLKEKLAAKTGYDKIIDIENTLKDGDMKTQELLKQEKTLKDILKTQERELEKLRKDFGFTEKLKSLNDELKQYKEANKELEKKMQAENQNYQKCHTKLMDLQSKIQRLKEEKLRWKKAIADKLPAPPNEVIEESKRSEEEILQESLTLLQKRLKTEKATNAKNLKIVRMEIEEYEKKVKEAEQEARLNTDKLSQLRKVLRFRQLDPLDDNEKNKTSINIQEEVKKNCIVKVRTNKSIKDIRNSQKLQEETNFPQDTKVLNEDTNKDIRDLKDDNKNVENKNVEGEKNESGKLEEVKDEKPNDEGVKNEKVNEENDKVNEELKNEQIVNEEVKKEERDCKVGDNPIDNKELLKVYDKKEEMEIPNEPINQNKDNDNNEDQKVEEAKAKEIKIEGEKEANKK